MPKLQTSLYTLLKYLLLIICKSLDTTSTLYPILYKEEPQDNPCKPPPNNKTFICYIIEFTTDIM